MANRINAKLTGSLIALAQGVKQPVRSTRKLPTVKQEPAPISPLLESLATTTVSPITPIITHPVIPAIPVPTVPAPSPTVIAPTVISTVPAPSPTVITPMVITALPAPTPTAPSKNFPRRALPTAINENPPRRRLAEPATTTPEVTTNEINTPEERKPGLFLKRRTPRTAEANPQPITSPAAENVVIPSTENLVSSSIENVITPPAETISSPTKVNSPARAVTLKRLPPRSTISPPETEITPPPALKRRLPNIRSTPEAQIPEKVEDITSTLSPSSVEKTASPKAVTPSRAITLKRLPFRPSGSPIKTVPSPTNITVHEANTSSITVVEKIAEAPPIAMEISPVDIIVDATYQPDANPLVLEPLTAPETKPVIRYLPGEAPKTKKAAKKLPAAKRAQPEQEGGKGSDRMEMINFLRENSKRLVSAGKDAFSLEDLRRYANILGLSSSGTKKAIIERIKTVLKF